MEGSHLVLLPVQTCILYKNILLNCKICVMLLPKDNLKRSEQTRAFKDLAYQTLHDCMMIKAWLCDKMMFTTAKTLKIEFIEFMDFVKKSL